MMHQPNSSYLERTDPTRNMARFYALEITVDLFGALWLERRWGRIGTYGQVKLQAFDNETDAARHINLLLKQKRRRGYRER